MNLPRVIQRHGRPAHALLALAAAPLLIAAAVAGSGCSESASATGPDTHGTAITWTSDVPAATTRAEADGKPMLLFFTASWCPPCQQVKKGNLKDAAVAAAIEGHAVPVWLQQDGAGSEGFKDLSGKYGVRGIPSFVAVKPDGTLIGAVNPGVEKQRLIGWLEGLQGG